MKFFFKILPYLLMLFLNYYGVKYGFEGMTAPHDVTFMGGLLLLLVIVAADISFVRWQVKKLLATKEETNENTSA